MPSRNRPRSRSFRSQRRELVWATTDQSVALVTGNLGTNLNLLAQLAVAGSSLTGVTIMRTHLDIYCTTAVAGGDDLRVGLIVGRLSEVGAGPPTGALSAADGELDWMLWRHEFAAPTYNPGGSNVLSYDIKAKRRMQELNQAYILSLLTAVAASHTYKISARVLLALP